MSSIWNKKSGTKLSTVNEGETYSISLPINNADSVQVISGSLPPGMQLSNFSITGTPDEVPRNTEFRFVLRAINNNKVFDRTYSIEVQGLDEPEWVTDEDLLPIGKNGTFYILDSSPVDFQLEAIDSDTSAGQTLRYFIASGDGNLPPGISLTEEGRLVGVVDPILALEKEAGKGEYDEGRFDRYPYDFSIKSTVGFDSFFYDINRYDFATPTRVPKKLNRNYQFTVSVSDGDSVAKRTFKIFVVGDDFLRADNVIMQVGTGVFTADNTYLRTPIWLTPSNLGVRRANNFITLFLETLDPNTISGLVNYDLLTENDDGTRSELPPGTEFDRNTGEIFGRVPYQPAVTREYKFSVNARRIESGSDIVELQQFAFEFTPINSLELKINKLGTLSPQAVGKTFSIGTLAYKVESINTFNSDFDLLTLDKPLFTEISQGTEINLGTVAVASQEVAESQKTFTVQLIGEIDSTITWLTNSDLGSIPSNYISILRVRAETTVPDSFMLYTLEDGELPPGLNLTFNGEIEGRVNNADVTEDTEYAFTVKAQDQFGFSAIERTFSLKVENKDDTLYSNVYYRPLLPINERQSYLNFVSDPEIFLPELVYRPEDANFGVQREINILAYAGIETEKASEYIAAIAKHASKKTLKIRDVKKAVANEPGTNNSIYEVIYLDVYDPYEKSREVAKTVKVKNTRTITADSIRTTPDNNLYDTTTLSYITVGQRINSENKIYFRGLIPIETRNGEIEWLFEDNVSLETRNGEVQFDFERGSSTNIFYRPYNENTVRSDNSVVKVSDPNSYIQHISNTSNIRDSLREIGKTERNFLPLWMRTAQPGTLQELGFTLAVPLAYCKPGSADTILSAIRINEFDFRQFNLEVDRFVIDATEENSQEQYIVFANYEFTLA